MAKDDVIAFIFRSSSAGSPVGGAVSACVSVLICITNRGFISLGKMTLHSNINRLHSQHNNYVMPMTDH